MKKLNDLVGKIISVKCVSETWISGKLVDFNDEWLNIVEVQNEFTPKGKEKKEKHILVKTDKIISIVEKW